MPSVRSRQEGPPCPCPRQTSRGDGEVCTQLPRVAGHCAAAPAQTEPAGCDAAPMPYQMHAF
eukprot:1157760-Pelagomonas_calceolata.AAC.2